MELTIKDIERMGDNLQGNIDFFAVVVAPEGTSEIYFKSFDNLKKYVKENYNDDLTHKENSKKKISAVRIWRK